MNEQRVFQGTSQESPMTGRELTGLIFEIQRYSIHDGPGIRTTVFLKGCPLRCAWCHNPESISPKMELSFLPARCIGCGYCFRACSRNAHVTSAGKHVLERDRCAACGTCATECYAGALEAVGRRISVEEALREVLKDKPFYETSGGGMTLSGGEPLMQIEFTEALLKAAKAVGLNCCIETCGFAPLDRLELVRPLVDLFLFDIKETDAARHEEFTGVPNDPILANLRRLHAAGAQVIVRLPIVPGYNDRADHFDAVGALCREMPGLKGVEVMPYHRLGDSKVERMGHSPATRPTVTPPEPQEVERWKEHLRTAGARVL